MDSVGIACPTRLPCLVFRFDHLTNQMHFFFPNPRLALARGAGFITPGLFPHGKGSRMVSFGIVSHHANPWMH
jgi:hypothetical protein